ncbi:hypothetical protein KJ682_17350, partial [bacterium]|nr:hypothetical protein [bacterium]
MDRIIEPVVEDFAAIGIMEIGGFGGDDTVADTAMEGSRNEAAGEVEKPSPPITPDGYVGGVCNESHFWIGAPEINPAIT